MIGRYPTPVEHLRLSGAGCDFWVKRDDRTAPLYGGNKVRKLEYLLARAAARKARRLVTIGAAGSHHVLATTIYGTRAGFRVTALLTPQPRTDHAVEVLRASLAQGLDAHPVGSMARMPLSLATLLRPGDFVIPPGGTTVTGTRGYGDAAIELCRQVEAGELPMPDLIFVPLGSGGTVAGLLAGFRLAGARTTIVGVRVVEPWMTGPRRLEWLAHRVEHASSATSSTRTAPRNTTPSAVLRIENRFLGAGYGFPTREGTAACEDAERVGIELEPTYTAKTFAAAQQVVAAGGARNVLYWHTFSSAPMAPLLVPRGERAASMNPALDSLFLPLR